MSNPTWASLSIGLNAFRLEEPVPLTIGRKNSNDWRSGRVMPPGVYTITVTEEDFDASEFPNSEALKNLKVLRLRMRKDSSPRTIDAAESKTKQYESLPDRIGDVVKHGTRVNGNVPACTVLDPHLHSETLAMLLDMLGPKLILAAQNAVMEMDMEDGGEYDTFRQKHGV